MTSRNSLYACLITTCCMLALTACSDDAAMKKEKAVNSSGRSEVTLRLAHATESAGDFTGAEKLYQQTVTQSPETPEPRLELAEFYKRRHEDRKAVEALEAALKVQPGNADIERDLANTYIGIAEPEKALAILEPAIAMNSHDALLYNSQGVALDQIGSYAQAQQSYKTAYALDPGDGMMFKVNTSMSYILAGSYDKAIMLLRPILDAPDAPPIVRQNLALAYGLKGESDNALKLGLQDLSESEAAENLKFYRMLAQRHAARTGTKLSSANPGAATVPASVVRDLFPEEEPASSASVTPGGDAPTVSTIIPAEKPVAAQPAAVQPVIMHTEESLPVVSQAPLIPETPKAVEIAPAPPAHVAVPVAEEMAQPQVISQPVVTTIKPMPSLRKPVPAVTADKDDDDDDDDVTPAPTVAHHAPAKMQPIATMDPSSGSATIPAPVSTPVTPDEDAALPVPMLKPDEH